MDHWRMLAWAERHMEGLEDSITGFIREKNPYPLVASYDHIAGEYVVTLRVRPDAPQPDDWVFRIGDTLHSMRVALDYLAFQIVMRHHPNADVTKIAFPICTNAAKYASIEGRCFGGAPAEAREIVKMLQPGPDAHTLPVHPLFLLNALENPHKHRHPLAADPAVTSAGYTGWEGGLKKIKITRCGIPKGPLKDGTEMFRYSFLDPSNAETDVRFKVTTHICFDREGPARGQIVLYALKSIRDAIRNDIFPALDRYAARPRLSPGHLDMA